LLLRSIQPLQRRLPGFVNLFNRSVEDFDLYVLRFTDYGKEFPKSQNMSPDAFIQLALQLTYYRSV